MKTFKNKIGFTLVEMLVVIGITTILVALVIEVSSKVHNQSRVQITRGVLATLNNALQQFADYGYNYVVPAASTPEEMYFYRSLDFPVDCNNFPQDDPGLERVVYNLLGASNVTIFGYEAGKPFDELQLPPYYEPVDEYNAYSGCEILLFFLNRVPQCRKTLAKIDQPLAKSYRLGAERSYTINGLPVTDRPLITDRPVITNLGTAGGVRVNRMIEIDGVVYPLMRIVDAWGTTLRYDYYMDWNDYGGVPAAYFIDMTRNKRTFPLITSAGPDGEFGTEDDITNR
ncbi:type II secretion system protein [Planctomycetota bacterium]